MPQKTGKQKPLTIERIIIKYLLIFIVLYLLFLILTKGTVTPSDFGLLIWR